MASTIKDLLDAAVQKGSDTYDSVAKKIGLRAQGTSAGQLSGADELRMRSSVHPGGVSDVADEMERAAGHREAMHKAKVDEFNRRAGARAPTMNTNPAGAAERVAAAAE